MIRGSRIADIFDSPETIAQAEKDGFVKYEEVKTVRETKAETPKSEDAEVKTPKTKRQ